ncbi:unnamed protein product [Cunninghamella blakesleeana]
MPLRFISNIINSILKQPSNNHNNRDNGINNNEHNHQKPSNSSITFGSSATLHGFFSKKSNDTDTSTISFLNNQKNWTSHLEQITYWQQQPSVFETMDLSKEIDKYTLMNTLGTGTFGRVYLAKEKNQNKVITVKVLKKSDVVRLKQVEHINSERLVLSQIRFPFIVQLYCTFQDQQFLYMVHEFVQGGELFKLLRKNKRFPDHTAKFYAGEVLLAIEYLHSKDIIYRDLKPENILIDAHGHIKIIDFGFAKYVHDITWTLCGTPDYLAPEVIQSRGYGKAVDWWSLGILIFEMLAGHPPFFDEDHLKLYEKILSGRIKWPSHFDTNAKDLLKKLLTSDLSKRYGNLKKGSEDIKKHPWFEGIDFQRLLSKKIRPPFIPEIQGDVDSSHFDKYKEVNERYGVTGFNDPFKHLFTDF